MVEGKQKDRRIKHCHYVVGYQDPETPPTGDPVAVEKPLNCLRRIVTITQVFRLMFKDLLRNAFKKTTYQIHKAISSGELKLYQGTVSETAPLKRPMLRDIG
jgi:hypothetical protein